MSYRFLYLLILLICPALCRGKFDRSGWYTKNVNLEQGLSQCLVTDMAMDAKGFLWVGTFDGLNRYDGSNILLFTHVPGKPSSLPSSHILRLFADSDFHLWVLTANGLCIFDTRQGKTIQTSFLSGQSFTWVCRNDEHSVWLYARNKGLFLVNTRDFTFRVFAQGNVGLSSNCEVLNLHKAGRSVFVAGSCGEVLRFDVTASRYSLFRHEMVKGGVFEFSGTDKYGNINLALQQTDLVQFDPVTMTFKPAEFHTKGINRISIRRMQYDAVNDVLLMGTYGQGLFIYDYVSGRIQPFKKYFENSISLSFGTVGFSLPGRTRYQYRLSGHDKHRINAEGRNYVSHTNLKPGHYTFEVKACNYDGIWNSRPASVAIDIASPFYSTWWFILIIVALVVELIYLLYRYRGRVRNQQEEIRVRHARELAEVEMKALRAQINPHFLFNSLNSINSYILKQDNKLASHYLVKFSQLVRNILQNSSSPYISLQEELNTIELYMMIEGMRFSNQFSYHIDVEPDVDARNILIPSLLLQPYVENAIWHGLMHKEGEKVIVIRVGKFAPESIFIQIDDNGVGRVQAAALERKPGHQKSYGMELGESRLKLMNEGNSVYSHVEIIDQYDKDHKPCGTSVRIVIPVLYLIDQNASLN